MPPGVATTSAPPPWAANQPAASPLSDARLGAGAVLFQQYGDSSTKYFHGRDPAVAKVHSPTIISQLDVQPGPLVLDLATPAGLAAALREAARRFSAADGGIFAARQCDMAARQQVLNSIPVRLSPGQAAQADGPGVITLPELQLALRGERDMVT
jgi:hypothetical protein